MENERESLGRVKVEKKSFSKRCVCVYVFTIQNGILMINELRNQADNNRE